MAQVYIEPSFATVLDRLLFLSRLYHVRLGEGLLSESDETNWFTFRATFPVQGGGESEADYQARREAWRTERVETPRYYVFSKWHSYRLGQVRPGPETYLATRPSPNRIQAREAVRLQLEDKFASNIADIAYNLTLIPLVDGLVW